MQEHKLTNHFKYYCVQIKPIGTVHVVHQTNPYMHTVLSSLPYELWLACNGREVLLICLVQHA